MADIDQEDVDRWLRRANHVLSRGDKFDNRVVQLCSSPSITGLVRGLIPVEKLWNFVRHGTHATSPPAAVVDELYIWVHVRSASAATSDDGVSDDGNLHLVFLHGTVWCNDKCKGELGLVEE